MNNYLRKISTGLTGLLILLFLFSSPGLADLKITHQATIRTMGIEIGSMTMNDYFKPQLTRKDENSDFIAAFAPAKNGQPDSYMINRYDKGVQWIIYDIDSSYGVIAIDEPEEVSDSLSDSLSSMMAKGPFASSDSVSWHYTAETLPDSTLNGIHCHGMRITARNETGEGEFRVDLWTANDLAWYPEYLAHEANVKLREDTNPFRTAQLPLAIFQMYGLDVDRVKELAAGIEGIAVSTTVQMLMDIDLNDMQNDSPSDTTEAIAEASPIDEPPAEEAVVSEDSARSMETMFDLPPEETPVDSAQLAAFEQLRNSMLSNNRPGKQAFMEITYEIIDVDRSPLPDSLFEIPPGYTEF